MKQSQLFTKTSKTFPRDEEAINARLLIKAGFIRKLSAGVYAYLPLGWRVLGKINNIIREEMNAIGAEELMMPSLVAKEYWEKSGRWDADIMFKINQLPTLPTGRQVTNYQLPSFGLGWTHEEAITHIATDFIHSYKDLPLGAYQIQTKFRNEPRAKNGLLRGREFLMKDLYSFHAGKEDLDNYYQKVITAYKKIIKRLSLDAKITEAAGGAFTKEYTHEFQVLSPAGEDTIFHCAQCDFSQNKEIVDTSKYRNVEMLKCPRCGGEIKESRGIEVANVFKLGTRYSDAYGLKFRDKDGSSRPVIMGSYGIGPTRLMGTLVEIYNDERGIVWPESVAPYKAHLLEIRNLSAGRQDEKLEIRKKAEKIYNTLQKAGVEILFDERDASAGEKFADADLIGIPYRLVVSEKTGSKIEVKARNQKNVKLVTLARLTNQLAN